MQSAIRAASFLGAATKNGPQLASFLGAVTKNGPPLATNTGLVRTAATAQLDQVSGKVSVQPNFRGIT